MELSSFFIWLISLEHLYFIIWLTFVVSIFMANKPSGDTLAWFMVVSIFPVFGMILYLLFGINWRHRKIFNRLSANRQGVTSLLSVNLSKYDPDEIFAQQQAQHSKALALSHDLPMQVQDMAKLLHCSECTVPNYNQDYTLYHQGEQAFAALKRDLFAARKSILMQYYIWRSDKLGMEIQEILLKKAREGVKIKLLFDGFGSLKTISREYRNQLRDAGVEFLYFLDIKHSWFKLNYRNHRKMTIIDYSILHTGGMNLGIEYITGGKHFDYWRDTNIRLQGEIIFSYVVVFMTDWLNSGGTIHFEQLQNELAHVKGKLTKESRYFMQLSSSGPDSSWPSLKYAYTRLITDARQEILIQTPYFVPTESILSQLKIAALSGKKVKIMVTGNPDHKITHWVARTFFAELLLAGIEIYSYNKGFLHSKVVICDEVMSTIGTCNFDARSFNINYEINCLFYDKDITAELRQQFEEDLKECSRITLENYQTGGFWPRLRNAFLKPLAPLL